jgi:hypothetical protein
MERRILREKRTIEAMIHLYCSDQHGTQGALCEDCDELLKYAWNRLDKCPFKDEKPACNHCRVHCYAPAKRQAVQDMMRYAGPRMLVRHPWLSCWHLIDTLRKAPSIHQKRK